MTTLLPLNLHGLSTNDASTLVLNAVAQGEGLCLEFKSSFQKEVIESLTAFANSQGGSILVGVSDSGKVLGVAIEAETTQSWINQCKQITSPSVIPDVDLVGIDGKTVAVVSVGEYPVKPVACKGRYFKRVGNANHQMSATEISDAHIKLINSRWDYYPDPEHAIDSISESKVQAFAEAVGVNPNNQFGREPVIPAKPGIQQSQNAFCLTPLDSGLRRNDGADGQSGMKESFQGVL